MFGYRILGFGSGGAGAQPVAVDYLVVGGGGSGGYYGGGGGGGAGGMRFSFCNGCASTIELKGGDTTITVGAGGAATIGGSPPSNADPGCDSVLPGDTVTITAAGGGNGAPTAPGVPNVGIAGGSGGGGKFSPGPNPAPSRLGGAGNTPCAPAALGGPQGNPGGQGQPVPSNFTSGGGGGHYSAGSPNGTGGDGSANTITGSSVVYSGGGGGGKGFNGASRAAGAGGGGEGGINNYGGRPTTVSAATPGADERGGGGGGSGNSHGGGNGPNVVSGGGGTGVVVVRIPTACTPACAAVSPGTNTIATVGSHKIFRFTVSGTLTL